MIKGKKAQIQSGETVVVVIIVIIMIIIGIVFVAKNKKSNIENEAETLNEAKAMEVAIIASNLNEVKCSEYSTMVKSCFDIYRLRAFSDVVKQNKQESFNYYYGLLGNTKVEIKILTKNPQENITLYDFDNSANKSSSPVFIPTIVLDSVKKESYFAIMEVRTFS